MTDENNTEINNETQEIMMTNRKLLNTDSNQKLISIIKKASDKEIDKIRTKETSTSKVGSEEITFNMKRKESVKLYYEQFRKMKTKEKVTNLSTTGFCGLDFPKVSCSMARFVLILNVFLPGLGTAIVGLLSYSEGLKKLSLFIALGCLQFITALLMIGWIMAFAFSLQLNVYATEVEAKFIKDGRVVADITDKERSMIKKRSIKANSFINSL